jgi:protein TonB
MGERQRPFQIGGPAAVSLLVNALLIMALLNLGISGPGRRAEAPALTVMSLAALKGVENGDVEAKAAEPATPAPSPPAQPVADIHPPQLAQPIPMPIVISSISPIAAMATPIAPVASVAPQLSPPAQQSASAQSPAAPAARRGTTDGLDADAPTGTSRSYAAKVRSWLYAHKVYPRRARMRHEEGKVQVRFVLDRAGVLIEGVVTKGSGNSTLDEEAAAMMRRASPFPKAPVEVPGERIEFFAPIEFTLPV